MLLISTEVATEVLLRCTDVLLRITEKAIEGTEVLLKSTEVATEGTEVLLRSTEGLFIVKIRMKK